MHLEGYTQGWFQGVGPGKGYRTLAEQLTGLETVLASAGGASVLDLGCAEGLISREFARRGAERVDGLSIIGGEITIGRELCRDLPVNLHVCDLGHWDDWLAANPQALLPRYDIVLALSIFHKVEDIGRLVERALTFAGEIVVVRSAEIIKDKRSKFVPYDLRGRLLQEFRLIFEGPGARGEWLGVFRK
jgi:2-polyprenyl-3-methyl-5-hydroxy-6-metoxy-1,4-benzoquinol methylase